MAEAVSFKNIEIKEGFFKERQEIVRNVSIKNIYKRFYETGRFEAVKCIYKDKDRPHIFFDSDVAKWLESAAYILCKGNERDLADKIDSITADIEKNQLPCGYFNSYFQVYEKENIFKKRTEHELYCGGHLIEAAVALYECINYDRLLKVMNKYVDYVYSAFITDKTAAFYTCGHAEIELALLKLYKVTKNKKHLELAEFFIGHRGKHNEESYLFTYPVYHQDHLPLREQQTAEGHSVRALYAYIGMSELAKVNGDSALTAVCDKLFDNIVNKRMYITGGLGSAYHGEAFTYDYHLPNEMSYAETCAGIAMCLFSDSMTANINDVKFSDAFERVLYNNVLGGISLDGKGFFYTNPHEMHKSAVDFNNTLKTKLPMPLMERVEVFDCSCCPPNLTRFIAQIGNFIYKQDKENIFVNQYISNTAKIGDCTINMTSGFPYNGKVELEINGGKPENLVLRIPHWCSKIHISTDGEERQTIEEKGSFTISCASGHKYMIEFEMKLKAVYANEEVWYNSGRKALCYGPLVMCAESADNEKNLNNVLVPSVNNYEVKNEGLFKIVLPAKRLVTDSSLYSFDAPKQKDVKLNLIPYFAYANRGPSDLQIWFL